MKIILGIVLVIFTGMVSGCGTLPNGQRWGQNATLMPGWQKLGDAAARAALSPATWIPAAGVVVFQIGDFDENLSGWAMDQTPVFGSRQDAADATDTIAAISNMELYLSIMLTPSGETPKDWALAKGKGAAVDFAAVALNAWTTDFLKSTTKRTRPDGSNDRSLPSGHASNAATRLTLAYENFKQLSLPQTAKTAIGIGSATLGALSAWGRVEAGRHYPSDVLAGLALGHFIALFVQDAFLGIDGEHLGLKAEPTDGGMLIGFTYRW